MICQCGLGCAALEQGLVYPLRSLICFTMADKPEWKTHRMEWDGILHKNSFCSVVPVMDKFGLCDLLSLVKSCVTPDSLTGTLVYLPRAYCSIRSLGPTTKSKLTENNFSKFPPCSYSFLCFQTESGQCFECVTNAFLSLHLQFEMQHLLLGEFK